MKSRLVYLCGLLFLAGCSSPLATVDYEISLSGTITTGYTATYRVGTGSEIAIPAILPQTIKLLEQPSGTTVSVGVRLTSQGNVTLSILANGEVCQTTSAVHNGGITTVESSLRCTR